MEEKVYKADEIANEIAHGLKLSHVKMAELNLEHLIAEKFHEIMTKCKVEGLKDDLGDLVGKCIDLGTLKMTSACIQALEAREDK